RGSVADLDSERNWDFQKKWFGYSIDLLHWRNNGRSSSCLRRSSCQPGRRSRASKQCFGGVRPRHGRRRRDVAGLLAVSRPEIRRPEQLKGGSVAISAFGTASNFVARYALEKIGLTP